MAFELGDSQSTQSINQAPTDTVQYINTYVDQEARLLAHQLLLKLQAKLRNDELILEYGRRFCRNLYAELTKQVTEEQPFSNDLFSVGVDGPCLLVRQQLDSSSSGEQGDGAVSVRSAGGGAGWEIGADDGYSCAAVVSDLTTVPDGSSACQNGNCPLAGQRRCSAASLSGSVNLTCSSCQSKSFFRRRLSLHGLNPFHRRTPEAKSEKYPLAGQTSAPEVPSSGGPVTVAAIGKHKCAGELRQTRVDMTVEVLREDLCTFLALNSATGSGHHAQSPRWDQCRLTLAKTPAGHLLQLFVPAKSTKAKKSIFCAAIKEAKDACEADALGHDCVFIIQLNDGTRCLFRLDTSEERRAWVYEMQRTGVSLAKIPGSGFPPAGSSNVRPRLLTFPPSEMRRIGTPDPIFSPVASVSGVPRGTEGGLTSGSRQNSLVSCPSTNSASRAGTPVNDNVFPAPAQAAFAGPMISVPAAENSLTESLAAHPWYHKTITRGEAAALVAPNSSSHESSHGRFLIRASETRPGEFVVTFNAYGKPKHLRICVEPDGQCRVQSLWFESVQAMTEHYRQHPLPLESGHTSDVRLTEPVAPTAAKSARGRSGSISSAAGDPCRTTNVMHFSSSDSRFKTTRESIDEESKGVM